MVAKCESLSVVVARVVAKPCITKKNVDMYGTIVLVAGRVQNCEATGLSGEVRSAHLHGFALWEESQVVQGIQ
jgi:hypothetical protein